MKDAPFSDNLYVGILDPAQVNVYPPESSSSKLAITKGDCRGVRRRGRSGFKRMRSLQALRAGGRHAALAMRFPYWIATSWRSAIPVLEP